MAFKSLATSGIVNFSKYQNALVGNEAFSPDSDFIIQEQLISSTVSSVTFSSIPSTYKHLEIRIALLAGTSGGTLNLTFNGDSGANYSNHGVIGYNGSVSSFGGAPGRGNILLTGLNVGANTTYPTGAIISIADYASTSKNKTLRSLWGMAGTSATTGEAGLYSGAWFSTSAVSSFTITTGGGNFASGSRVTLYGSNG